MANGKKSFMFYCDWKETFYALPNDKAGELIKHILSYVNDENPETEDLLIKAVFANIKATLKRDLKKWESKSEQNKLNALKRWNANASERIKSDANHADSDKDKDSVNDKVIVKDINKKNSFNFRKELIELGFHENLVVDWMKVRKTKKSTNSETAFNGFISQVKKTNLDINVVLKECVERSWSGFKSEWLKEKNSDKKEKVDAWDIIQQVKQGTYEQ